MRSSAHAESSATIFGGKPEDYKDIHDIIDLNKAVHASVKGRFFMHHYDVGGAILEVLFGSDFVNSSAVPVKTKDVMLQHLIEDYGQVPMMVDWLVSMTNYLTMPSKFSVLNSLGDTYVQLTEADSLPHGREREMMNFLKHIREIVSLESFTKHSGILQHPFRTCIFGHYTGLDLLKKIIKPKDQTEDDFIVDSVSLLFYPESGKVLGESEIPTLVDWMKLVNERSWMRRPEGMERHDPEFVKAKMDEIKVGGEAMLGIKEKGSLDGLGPMHDLEKCTGGRYD